MATAFSVFCEADGSLTFYKRDTVPTAGSEFEGKVATAVYTGIEDGTYDGYSGKAVPWYDTYSGQIQTVVVKDVITPITTSMWFYQHRNVISMDLIKLDTSNVTNMSQMFGNCDGITSLDLSSFNTSNVTNMREMFSGSDNLATIYVSDLWTTDAVTSHSYMFDTCNNLVGGNGTAVATKKVYDKTYAKIDKDGQEGYLTYKRYVVPEDLLIQNTTLYDLADKIRVLSGTENAMTPAEMQTTLETHNTEMTQVLSEQDAKLAELATALEGKAGAPALEIPIITVLDNGLITATANNLTAEEQLVTQAAKTIIPSASNQTAVSGGVYTTGDVMVAGDSNLLAENIKSGVSIFGVNGNLVIPTQLKVKTGTLLSSIYRTGTVDLGMRCSYFVAFYNGGSSSWVTLLYTGGSTATGRWQYTWASEKTASNATFDVTVTDTAITFTDRNTSSPYFSIGSSATYLAVGT